jgi:hypothetical protein
MRSSVLSLTIVASLEMLSSSASATERQAFRNLRPVAVSPPGHLMRLRDQTHRLWRVLTGRRGSPHLEPVGASEVALSERSTVNVSLAGALRSVDGRFRDLGSRLFAPRRVVRKLLVDNDLREVFEAGLASQAEWVARGNAAEKAGVACMTVGTLGLWWDAQVPYPMRPFATTLSAGSLALGVLFSGLGRLTQRAAVQTAVDGMVLHLAQQPPGFSSPELTATEGTVLDRMIKRAERRTTVAEKVIARRHAAWAKATKALKKRSLSAVERDVERAERASGQQAPVARGATARNALDGWIAGKLARKQ